MEAIGRAGGEARGRARQVAAQQAAQQQAAAPRFQDREAPVSVSREGISSITPRSTPITSPRPTLGAAELP
jgi:hypothetical protein